MFSTNLFKRTILNTKVKIEAIDQQIIFDRFTILTILV